MKHKGGLNFDEDYMDKQMELLDTITNEYKGDFYYDTSGIDLDFDDFIKNFSKDIYKPQLKKMMKDGVSQEEIKRFQNSYLDIKPKINEYLKYRKNLKRLKKLPSPPKGTSLTGKGKKKKRSKKTKRGGKHNGKRSSKHSRKKKVKKKKSKKKKR